MSSAQNTSRERPEVRDLFIVGDFIKYFLRIVIPFFLIGAVYGFFYECYLTCILLNPIIYAVGITIIIIVIKHDVNDILALIGRAKEPQLALHIKHHNAIQKIVVAMSYRDYTTALQAVDRLLAQEPDYTNALNLKGQILLEGFRNNEEACHCFERVLKIAKPDSEDYKLAQAMRASCL